MIRLLPVTLATLIFISCADNAGDKGANMCPVDGANLYIKCADGRSRTFGLGYSSELSVVRVNGEWKVKEVGNYCQGEPVEIHFYLQKASFRFKGRKSGDITVTSPWQRNYDCNRMERMNEPIKDYFSFGFWSNPLATQI